MRHLPPFLSVAVAAVLGLSTLAGCDEQASQAQEYQQSQSPIFNGTPDTSEAHRAAVSLHMPGLGSFCTGTLITPRHVLTAAHCVLENPDEYFYPQGLKIGIGPSFGNYTHVYESKTLIPHKDYDRDTWQYSPDNYDIGIVELKTAVPEDVVKPIPPLPPSKIITQDMIDAQSDGYPTTFVGFGRTEKGTSGKKLKFDGHLIQHCAKNNTTSCGAPRMSYAYDNSDGGPCNGDSGGPFFVEVEGVEYVGGVTSAGDGGCIGYGYSTSAPEHYDFIRQYAPLVAVDNGETCFNKVDDNGDGLVDCDDPTCNANPICGPEICDNKVDDNINGFADCDDPDCADEIHCQPEVCNNKVDDNANNLVDCDDPDCFRAFVCQPEICRNNIDDNGDGLLDCADPKCAATATCQYENCTNNIDDNGNGLVDCADPTCVGAVECSHIAEICDNDIDDNEDRLIDCADPDCVNAPACQQKADTPSQDDDSCTTSPHRDARTPLWLAAFLLIALIPYRRMLAVRRNEKGTA